MKKILLRFKWYLIALGVLLLTIIIKSFGASSKQEKYKQVVEDFLKSKRDELHKREDKLSDSIIKSEEAKIVAAEVKIDDLQKQLERRNQTGRKIDSRATSQRLRELGLK
jgi:FixJ family two-component response regulator